MKLLITETQYKKLIEDINMGKDIKQHFDMEDEPNDVKKIGVVRHIDFKHSGGKTITFKFTYFDTSKHSINDRILERTKIGSIREFNNIIRDNIKNLWDWSGGQTGDYTFIYPEKELQVPMKMKEGRRTRDGKTIQVFVPTILNSSSSNSKYDKYITYVQNLNI